jgi:dGTPase
VDIWERTLRWEKEYLSRYAQRTAETKGRRYHEEECPLRTPYQRDRDRILHSKAFRRLRSKTQVFIRPEGDHYRTRLTHVLEVAQISRTVARALGLNEDLTEAIALGHDLGHTPFGHAGEAALARLLGHFRHNEQSLRVVDVLEEHSPRFPGLNLTHEVRDGILTHTGPQLPATLEGQVVRLCDRIAYLNHDVEDAVRGGLLTEGDLPSSIRDVLGSRRAQRIDTMVKAVVAASADQPRIAMTPEVAEATDALREFLFATVYVGSEAKREEAKVYGIIEQLFNYYLRNPQHLEERIGRRIPADQQQRAVCDYIAGMTDGYAIAEYERLFLPAGWKS